MAPMHSHPSPADDQATSAPADTDEPCPVAAFRRFAVLADAIRDHFASDDALVGGHS